MQLKMRRNDLRCAFGGRLELVGIADAMDDGYEHEQLPFYGDAEAQKRREGAIVTGLSMPIFASSNTNTLTFANTRQNRTPLIVERETASNRQHPACRNRTFSGIEDQPLAQGLAVFLVRQCGCEQKYSHRGLLATRAPCAIIKKAPSSSLEPQGTGRDSRA